MAVLLDLELRRLSLDPPADGIQATDTRVAEPAEDELAGDACRDHLVVDHVRRHPRQGQVASALADDLVACRERDEMREAFDRDRVAVAHDVADRVGHRGDFRGGHACSIGDDAGRGLA